MHFKAILIAAFALATTVLAVPAPDSDDAVSSSPKVQPVPVTGDPPQGPQPIRCSTKLHIHCGRSKSIIFHIEVQWF
jgi:hypothetical protein